MAACANPIQCMRGRPAPWRFGVGAHACMVMVRPSGRPVLLLLLLRPSLPASRPVRLRKKHSLLASVHAYHPSVAVPIPAYHVQYAPSRDTAPALKTRLSCPGWETWRGRGEARPGGHARTARLHPHPVRLHATASVHHRPRSPMSGREWGRLASELKFSRCLVEYLDIN